MAITKENIFIFALVGILVLAAMYFNSTKTGTAVAISSGGDGCFCVNDHTVSCSGATLVCGSNEMCQSGECVPSQCRWGWFCLDQDTRAYRTATCQITQQSDCGKREQCVNGYCQATCTNECNSAGTRQCIDSTSYRVCGNYDSDPCLEWSASSSCSSGQICSSGQCIDQCTDTDGGLNYFVRGTVNSTNATFTDYCTNSLNLQEGYCSGGNLAVIGVTCTTVGGTSCSNGACTNQTNQTGIAYFTSNPTGATVQKQESSSSWSVIGITPITKEFLPGTYTARANKWPFFQEYDYRTFTINSGQKTNVHFILNQTHHSACLNTTNATTCQLISGPGTIACQPLGASCTPISNL